MRLPDGADSYFNVDGAPLNERNPKWLNDDYVKFLRYGQLRISAVGAGVLGFITNHSYLDNPTFRGMRQSLMQSFQGVSVIDLHGNSKKGEVPPPGVQDQNVFDIQQGVAIGLLLKRARHDGRASTVVRHGDLWGSREEKYDTLMKQTVGSFPLAPLEPQSPFYLFVPSDTDLDVEYQTGWKVDAIFPVHSLGIVTARDSLAIHPSPRQTWETVKHFASLPPEEARRRYALGNDAEDWRVSWAQEDLHASGPKKELVHPILYRPFAVQYTYYTGRSRGFMCRPRTEVMGHMLGGDNLGLHVCRQIVSDRWQHILATNALTDDCYVSNKSRECGYTMPLFLLSDSAQAALGRIAAIRPNLAPKFTKALESKLRLTFTEHSPGDLKRTFGPRDVLAYVYAILHSPSYRGRYLEFLRRDFPSIPLTSNAELFATLVGFGADLLALHVLDESYPEASWNRSRNRKNPLAEPGVTLEGSGITQVVERYPAYLADHVYINSQRYFSPVAQAVWEFEVGAYQVCEKWLKDRRGRQLTNEEVATYCKIVAAVRETTRIMNRIDQAIEAAGGWPIS
jgi:predicted helicase